MTGPKTPVRVDLSNGLIEADARLSMSAVGRACRRLGLWFPLARPLPGFSLGEACARLPTFLDAFVAQAEGVVDGRPLATPRAPRAAMGPDLLGALALPAPLAAAERVRVRVFDETRTSSFVEEHESADAAARRLVALLDEGRAFSAEARREGGRVLVHVLAGVGVAPGAAPARRPFAHEPRARVRSGVSLVPGDGDALARALTDGARVLASPFMGRVGAMYPAQRDVPRLSLEEGCARLARALDVTERTHVH